MKYFCSLLIAVFVFDEAHACKRLGPYKVNAEAGIRNSLEESPIYKYAYLRSFVKDSKNSVRTEYLVTIYNPSDKTCHKLTMEPYGGDGDCREKAKTVADEKTDLSACGRDAATTQPVTCETVTEGIKRFCSKERVCSFKTEQEFAAGLDVYETLTELDRQRTQQAIETLKLPASGDAIHTVANTMGVTCKSSGFPLWRGLVAAGDVGKAYKDDLRNIIEADVREKNVFSFLKPAITMSNITATAKGGIIQLRNEPLALERLKEIRAKHKEESLKIMSHLKMAETDADLITRIKIYMGKAYTGATGRDSYYGLEEHYMNFFKAEQKAATKGQEDLQDWWRIFVDPVARK